MLLMVLISVEALLINTVISPFIMPNFPSAEAYSHFNLNGYQRPYSFGGNASVSSSIFVIIFGVLTLPNMLKYLAVGVVFLFNSGSGFVSLISLFILRRKRFSFLFSIFIFLFFILFYPYIIALVDSLGLKLNSNYVRYLINYKSEQISLHFEGFSLTDYLIGNLESIKSGYGGDFSWLYFVKSYGFISLVFMVLFVLSKANKKTLTPIIIALLATFHYPVIFFLPGQILLGYLITDKYRTPN